MPGAYSVTESIVIARPPEDVFAVVADPERDPEWCVLVPESHFTGDAETGLGTYEFVQRIPIHRVTPGWGEILESDPPRLLKSRSGFERTELQTTIELEAVADGTRITQTNAVRWLGWQRFMSPLLERATRRAIVDQLAALKQLLEADAQA